MNNNPTKILSIPILSEAQPSKESSNGYPRNIAIVHIDLAKVLDEQASWMYKAFELGMRCGRKEKKENEEKD